MFHQYFQPSVVPNYRPKLALETRKFIGRLHNSPEDWLRHVRQYAVLYSFCGVSNVVSAVLQGRLSLVLPTDSM